MLKTRVLSTQTRNNWMIDFSLFLGAVISTLTGIYFLLIPNAGYRGGRNPMYGITILFQRSVWKDLHTWFGIIMILAAVVHISIHWKWIVNMTKRVLQELFGSKRRFNARSRMNLVINMATGLSFILTGLSGLYLFFVPGGRNGAVDPMILFSHPTWVEIHTWSGVMLPSIAMFHFYIHWGWIKKVTRKMLGTVITLPNSPTVNQPVNKFPSQAGD